MLHRSENRNFGEDQHTNLTRREREVASLAATGMTNKAIASELKLREGTIKIHLHNIFLKLGISRRTNLIVSGLPLVRISDVARSISSDRVVIADEKQ